MGKTAMKILSLKDEEFYEVIFDVIRMAFNTELAACVIQKTCDVDKKYFINHFKQQKLYIAWKNF